MFLVSLKLYATCPCKKRGTACNFLNRRKPNKLPLAPSNKRLPCDHAQNITWKTCACLAYHFPLETVHQLEHLPPSSYVSAHVIFVTFEALAASWQAVVQLWPLCVVGSHFVHTCYLVLHLSFQKSDQVPVTKLTKFYYCCAWATRPHRIASGFCQKACGFATYACHPANFFNAY